MPDLPLLLGGVPGRKLPGRQGLLGGGSSTLCVVISTANWRRNTLGLGHPSRPASLPRSLLFDGTTVDLAHV